jgi:hypothetical protein
MESSNKKNAQFSNSLKIGKGTVRNFVYVYRNRNLIHAYKAKIDY